MEPGVADEHRPALALVMGMQDQLSYVQWLGNALTTFHGRPKDASDVQAHNYKVLPGGLVESVCGLTGTVSDIVELSKRVPESACQTCFTRTRDTGIKLPNAGKARSKGSLATSHTGFFEVCWDPTGDRHPVHVEERAFGENAEEAQVLAIKDLLDRSFAAGLTPLTVVAQDIDYHVILAASDKNENWQAVARALVRAELVLQCDRQGAVAIRTKVKNKVGRPVNGQSWKPKAQSPPSPLRQQLTPKKALSELDEHLFANDKLCVQMRAQAAMMMELAVPTGVIVAYIFAAFPPLQFEDAMRRLSGEMERISRDFRAERTKAEGFQSTPLTLLIERIRLIEGTEFALRKRYPVDLERLDEAIMHPAAGKDLPADLQAVHSNLLVRYRALRPSIEA